MKILMLFLSISLSILMAQDNKFEELIQKLQKENSELKQKIEKLQEQKIKTLLKKKDTQETILGRISLLEKLLQQEIEQRKTQTQILKDKIEESTSTIKISYLQNTCEEAKNNTFYNKPMSELGRDFSFTKEREDSILKISYCDNFFVHNTLRDYFIHIDDVEVCHYRFHGANANLPSTITNYIGNISKGSHKIKIISPTNNIGYGSNISIVVEEIASHKIYPQKMK